MNRKLEKLRQWAGERMGGDAITNVSEDFKALEVEMAVRQDGMERLHKSMNHYVKWISKKCEADEGEKATAVSYLGSTMISHGQDFHADSLFGRSLIAFGRVLESLGRQQEVFVARASATWLQSLDHSIAQLKDYQASRKKLEQRRLAYDACLSKVQKAKKEDFRIEEDLRVQKAKYDESNEDTMRKMQEVQESEGDSVESLREFLEAQLNFHEQCCQILRNLRDDWNNGLHENSIVMTQRTRSNTTNSQFDRGNQNSSLRLSNASEKFGSSLRNVSSPAGTGLHPAVNLAGLKEACAVAESSLPVRGLSSTPKKAPPPPPPSRSRKPPPPPLPPSLNPEPFHRSSA